MRHVEASENILRLCTTMDPRFKLALWDKDTSERVTRQLMVLVDEFEKKNVVVAEPAPETESKKPRALAKHDSHGDWLRGMQGAAASSADTVSNVSNAKRQLRAYLDSNCCAISTRPLEWWRQQPNEDVDGLLLLVRRLFSVPASNADVERVFSAMRN